MRRTARPRHAVSSAAQVAALAGIVLLGGCAKPARGADVVTIRDGIGDDQRREAIEIRIDDGEPLRLEVRDAPLREQRSITVRIPDGVHSYTLAGEMETRDGKKVPIRGSGAIVRYDWLAPRFLRDAKRVGAGKAWETIHKELAAHTSADLSIVALTDSRPVTVDDLAEAETTLGFSLPRAYQELALQFGSWMIGSGKEPPSSLAHPSELLSVWDWIVRDTEASSDREAILFPDSIRSFPWVDAVKQLSGRSDLRSDRLNERERVAQYEGPRRVVLLRNKPRASG